MTFSFIDIETTGLYKHDKIVEIAIIKADENGEIVDKFESLIDPERDVGPVSIHGITASMVNNAPTFKDIAEYLVDFLNETILVAHNKRFDLKFLRKEFNNCDYPCDYIDGICTLHLSKYVLEDLPCRKLSSICQYLDIELINAHSAMDDCFATYQAFYKMYEIWSYEYDIEDFIGRFYEGDLFYIPNEPSINKNQISGYIRKEAYHDIRVADSKIQELIKSIPDIDQSKDYRVSEYLNLIDRVLEDRIITDEEICEIEAFANEFSLGKNSMIKVHEEYFRRLARYYLRDNHLSDIENDDLNKVGDLLGISSEDQQIIIDLEFNESKDENEQDKSINSPELSGLCVCFTGELLSTISGKRIDKSTAHVLSIENGLEVKKSVSKKLDVLVVADPNSKSNKAKRARELGITIMSEIVFWKKMGIEID